LNGPRREKLAAAYLLARSLVARPDHGNRLQSQVRRRSGAVREAVIRVLARTGEPMRASEIHAVAENLVGEPLSWNTVRDCLHKNARRPESPIAWIGWGRYRYR